jgi:ABC-type multidrug transport system fused ATPase/permease subunit
MNVRRRSAVLLRRAGGHDLSERPLLEGEYAGQQPAARRSMRSRLNQLIGRRRKSVVALVFASTLSGFTEALTLTLIALIAADVVKSKGLSQRTSVFHSLIGLHTSVGTLIVIALCFATARLLLQFPISILPARVASDVQARVRAGLFDAFTYASWSLQSRDREGQLQETMTSQAAQATGAALNITALISAAFSFLALLASALILNLVAAAVVLVVALGLFATLRPLRGAGARRARALSKAQIRYAAGVAESNRLAEETHVFGTSAAQRRQIDALIAKAAKLFFETQALTRLGSNVSQSLIYLLLVAALAALHALGGSHAASLGAVVLILVRASSGAQSVQAAYQGLVQSMPFVERVQDAEARYRASMPPTGDRALSGVRSLAFRAVTYSYRPGTPVLREIDFEVEGGEVVGVIGPSGAGKSTLVQLLLRLRAPDEGQYLVNGTPSQEFRREDWNRRISYVPQEPRLLHASVAENIRYFRELDDDAVERAGRLARIHDDVMGWTNGYETIVGPRADAVSGGQRQRICLARALVARPEVLVLDEPTSALDPRSETLIQESLTGLKHELTLFIVAHRMSTLDICDRVMVVIDGRLVAFDTIGYLQQHNSYYRSASALALGGDHEVLI